jgi:hypothetical protein
MSYIAYNLLNHLIMHVHDIILGIFNMWIVYTWIYLYILF